jgi:DNA polymerase II large subunit
MGIFDRFKKKTEPAAEPAKEAIKKPRASKKSAKEIADEKGEPYVAILRVELDPENIGNGAFELDWNDKFVSNLVRAGYQLKANEEDATIVDRWFQEVCRNVAMENFEQWEANQPYDARPRVMDKKDLGNGKTQVS